MKPPPPTAPTQAAPLHHSTAHPPIARARRTLEWGGGAQRPPRARAGVAASGRRASLARAALQGGISGARVCRGLASSEKERCARLLQRAEAEGTSWAACGLAHAMAARRRSRRRAQMAGARRGAPSLPAAVAHFGKTCHRRGSCQGALCGPLTERNCTRAVRESLRPGGRGLVRARALRRGGAGGRGGHPCQLGAAGAPLRRPRGAGGPPRGRRPLSCGTGE